MDNQTDKPIPTAQPSLFSLLGPYRGTVISLVLLAIASNVLTLLLPKLISHGIDGFARGGLDLTTISFQFAGVALLVFLFTYLQSIVQTFLSEKVARDLRAKLAAKISRQSYAYIQEVTAGKLLTNLTADIDSVKLFVSQAIVSLVSSVCIIIGASIILLVIDWKLALAVLTIVPGIGGTFALVLGKVRVLFTKSREVIDRLNKIINESILGSALIRVLNSQMPEYAKFELANGDARNLGVQILKLFSILIPAITFFAGFASIIILSLGGHFVISGAMSLGDFAAFNSYLGLLVFPILIIGFMSNVIAQATASYVRVSAVLEAPEIENIGTITDLISGNIEFEKVTVSYGGKPVLRDVSLSVSAGTRTAIIGPTSAGKTQLLYLLTGLITPNLGTVLLDGRDIRTYEKKKLHQQVGFVFQDSVMFNLSLRKNIAFSETVSDEVLERAIATAELQDLIASLPDGLETIVSERGTTLSGGQKQRIMLARALVLEPKVLLLDDFTARVDTNTEKKILGNVQKNYPGITLISVTQKIEAVSHYDQIIVLMEGEVIATGTHEQLLHESPEYVQIYNSQASTNSYELHA